MDTRATNSLKHGKNASGAPKVSLAPATPSTQDKPVAPGKRATGDAVSVDTGASTGEATLGGVTTGGVNTGGVNTGKVNTGKVAPSNRARLGKNPLGRGKQDPSEEAAARTRAAIAAMSPERQAAIAKVAKDRQVAREARNRRAEERAKKLEPLWAEYLENRTWQTRNQLVEAYQSFVREVVRRFGSRLPRSVDRGDLETAANVGLISAVEGFDPTRGVRFESYCELRAKGALLDELRSQDWLPRPWRQRVEQQKRAVESLRSELSREPADQEIAAALGMDFDTYRQLFGVGLPSAPTGSMPTEDGDEDSGPILDVVPDRHSEAPEDRLTREELLQLVTQRLSEQEYRIVYLKYWEELPMREIGDLTNLSESRVCKIHARLMDRLRDRLRANQPD